MLLSNKKYMMIRLREVWSRFRWDVGVSIYLPSFFGHLREAKVTVVMVIPKRL